MSDDYNRYEMVFDKNAMSESNKYESEVCNLIEEIFGFTFNKKTSAAKKIVYLEELAATFQNGELDLENLEHALFERLFLTEPKEFVYSSKEGVDEDACEKKVILYLYRCYLNIGVAGDKYKGRILDLIMRNVLTSLKQPELYENQDLYKQFYEVLKEDQPNSDQFFFDVYNAALSDEGEMNIC